MAGGRGLWAPRSICIVLYFYLCFTYYSSQKSKQHQNKAFYASSISSRPRIETYGYQTRNSSATRSNGLVLNSTRALLGCRLMLNTSISLLLIHTVKNIWKSYIWTADKDRNESDPRSENKAWKKKKIRPVRDLNPWPLRYRCSALPTELTSLTTAKIVIQSMVKSYN